jgi:alkanesulfonate monooxygenase
MLGVSTPLRFGWYIPTHGDGTHPGNAVRPSMEMFLRVAHAAEDAGFDFSLVPVATGCYEAWVTTAMLSAQTTRLKMLVAARPGIVQPSHMARMVSTFDQNSGGRVYVNLIAGGGPDEMAQDGVFLGHDERYAFMDEAVTLMKQLWLAEGPVDFRGKHVRVDGAVCYPKPVQQPHPPFYIGGISPAAVDVGAKHAACYLYWGNTPAQIAKDVEAVRDAARRYGRDGEIRHGMRLQICVRETEAEARAAAFALIEGATERQRASRMAGLGAESHADARMRRFAEEAADNDWWIAPNLWAGLTTIRHGAGVMIVGNPRQAAETIQQFIDVGCTEFCLSGYPHDDEAERFGRLVMPYFRDRLA